MFSLNLIKKWRRRYNKECESCGKPLKVHTVNGITGQYEQVKVWFDDMKIRSCRKSGHHKRYLYPDFGYELTEEIFWGDESPTSRTNAWLNLTSKTKCYSCEGILDERFTVNKKLTYDLDLEKVPELKVAIKGPVVRCRNCNSKQIIGNQEIGNQISEAIVDAFDKINLHH